MEKVKLPREVDKAINTCRMADISDYGIVALTIHKIERPIGVFSPSVIKSLEVIKRYTFSDLEDEDIEWKVSADGPAHADKLLQALANGWEVESAPDEIVKKAWEDSHSNGVMKDENFAFCTGMLIVLNAYNIRIPGVNTE